MDYMNSLCDTIYLKASAEVLAAHLKMGKVVRPLIVGKSEEELTSYIQNMLTQREPFYMKAKHIFNVDLLNSREKVAESVRLLREATGI
jgi:shikimate kinase